MYYLVTLADTDGCTIYQSEIEGKKAAIRHARGYLAERLPDASHATLTDDDGNNVWFQRAPTAND